MKHRWLARTGTKNLLLVFGGWALGSAPFEGLLGEDDVLFVEDYRHLDDPLPNLKQYDRINLLAFSFGVASAAHWLEQTGFTPDRLVAASGTLTPADSLTGISPDMIRATADHLTEDSFAKFCRRAGIQAPVPKIDLTAAREELHAVIGRGPARERAFDRVWIPQRDRIIPTQAQAVAWQPQASTVRAIPGAHIPFRAGQSWKDWIA
ncbi:pimeloyl-ACP methyl esterase BioG family protein [Ruegeria sp.]|uniref:pimeloyl-ACP methyl esterase BioG family protein n=1 Tax=Ruegeria sp. TaxID=1879320 RepID=UPI003C7E072C